MRKPALRTVLLLVSAIVLLDVLFFSAIAPLLPTYVANLHLSKTQAGLLVRRPTPLGTLAGVAARRLAREHIGAHD